MMDPVVLVVQVLNGYPVLWKVVLGLWLFVNVWKACPTEWRQSLEEKAPRIVGVIRVLAALLPGLVDAYHAVNRQIVRGQPKHGDARASVRPPPLPILLALALTLAIVSAPAMLTACSADTGRRVAHVSVVSLGGALALVQQEHQEIYRQATGDLTRALAQRGASIADYDREVAPLTEAFRLRGDVIQSLDADLYAAAAVIDATRTGSPSAYASVARRLLSSLERKIRVLHEGAVLPPVPIPREIEAAITTLRTIAGGAQ